jgi:hypothetical protein
MRLLRAQVWFLVLPLLIIAGHAAPIVQISELAASGHQGVRDEDGDTPDWVELRNTSTEPVNLDGWILSEESRRAKTWTLPSTNLPPGDSLVIFASGKNRRVPGQPQHASFKLPASDGVLVLRSPTGEVSRVGPYPLQVAGVTYGLVSAQTGDADFAVVIGPDAELRYLLPTDDRAGTNWLSPDFDDSRWLRGRNGIGYDTRGDYRALIRTDLGQGVAGHCAGLYLRYRFVLTNAAAVQAMTMHVQYDDGYAAWINGYEVARGNAPPAASWNSLALANRPNDKCRVPEDVPLKVSTAHLANGTNWLAVHVFNVSLQSSDLLFRGIVDLSAPVLETNQPSQEPVYTYLTKPTPGSANAAAISLGPSIESVMRQPMAPPAANEPILVTAKVTGLKSQVSEVQLRYRIMEDGQEIELPMADDGQHGDGAPADHIFAATIPAGAAKPGQMIRYCVVAKDTEGAESRWPLFADRLIYSAYDGTVVLDPSLKTRLPVLHLFNPRGVGAGRRRAPETVSVFYDGELYDHVLMTVHGQISRGFPKTSYNLAFPRDHLLRYQPGQARVRKIALLANYADKSKIRNTLAYEMIAASGSVGHFAFPVRVQLNSRFHSVAEIVEHGDSRWLKRVGRDPQGALYKMNNNLSGTHGAEKKTRQFESAQDLASFASALSEDRPLEARAAYAYRHIDIPQCVSYFVAMDLISSDDHGHKNYYLYRDTRHTGEWALFPWDVDLSWGRNWTGQYFNETMFSDNPLDLYRNGRSKPSNRLYNLFFEYPDFRQMYLRRLRTVMDEVLQPPGTPRQQLIIEKRIRELMDQIDPPGVKPSDADLDDAGRPTWGQAESMRRACFHIMDEHLPGRRQYLFKSSKARLFGDRIPASQAADAGLTLDPPDPRRAPNEQFVRVTNPNKFAVDLTGWTLTGAGIEHRFRPGTVIPAGKVLYVVADVPAFRAKPPTNDRDIAQFVQGDWKGHLGAKPGPLQLVRKDGSAAAKQDVLD